MGVHQTIFMLFLRSINGIKIIYEPDVKNKSDILFDHIGRTFYIDVTGKNSLFKLEKYFNLWKDKNIIILVINKYALFPCMNHKYDYVLGLSRVSEDMPEKYTKMLFLNKKR